MEESLRQLLVKDRTEYIFISPGAPHFGGKWEASVKSIKHHLKRVVGDRLITFEEFSSLLAQIEGVLNYRPLCALSDDPNDCEVLTPGNFLIGVPINTLPEPSATGIPESRLSQFQKLRVKLDHFWRRWVSEYLQRFQQNSK